MKQLICLASEPWQSVPTRTQQLMTRLKGAQVLFFEPPAERGRDARQPGRKMRPGLTVYTLPPVLNVEERHDYLFRRNQAKLAKYIEARMERHRFREPVLWCTMPEHVHLTDYLPYRGLVYDCDRAWPGLPPRWETDLAQHADVIFAASPVLAGRLSPVGDNIALLPNGANHPMFSRTDLDVPADLRGLRGPVLGYAGSIWRDLDLGPVLQAAADLPGAAFVFVGRVEQNPWLSMLEELPNVRFLGQRPPVELPDYLGRFDVCLNLLRRKGAEQDVLPPRIFEYFSTGKPVVSMLYPDQVEHFPDVVYGAHTAAEFSQLCRRALDEAGDWARRRRREYGEANAWSRRAEEVERILSAIGLY